MATRRYHKKSAKGRKVGRKSRKVRGGGLRKEIKTEDISTFGSLNDLVRTKKFGPITKELYQIKITGAEDTDSNPTMTWKPKVGMLTMNAARLSTAASQSVTAASSGLKIGLKSVSDAASNSLGWFSKKFNNNNNNKTGGGEGDGEVPASKDPFPAETFRNNLNAIYGESKIDGIEKITTAPIVDVVLTPSAVTIKENTGNRSFEIKPQLNADVFRKNVVAFYQKLND